MKSYGIFKFTTPIDEHHILNSGYYQYEPCYKTMEDLFNSKKEFVFEKKSNKERVCICVLKLLNKTEVKSNIKDKPAYSTTMFYVTKILSGKEILNEYLKLRNAILDSEILDIIFDDNSITDEDILNLFNSMQKSLFLKIVLKHKRVNNTLLLQMFNSLTNNKKIEKTFLGDLLLSILNNPNVSHDVTNSIIKILLNHNLDFSKIKLPNYIRIKFYEEVIKNGFNESKWDWIAKDSQTTKELLMDMLKKITDTHSNMFYLDYNIFRSILREIIKNPLSDKDIYKYILKSEFPKYRLGENFLCSEIIKKPNIDSEIIDLTLKVCYSEEFLVRLIETEQLTIKQVDFIINNHGRRVGFSDFIISKLSEYNEFNPSQLKKIINYSNNKETNKLLIGNPSIIEIISDLKEKALLSTDIEDFKKLYDLEDLRLQNQIKNQSKDSELPALDYKLEKIKLLNSYLLIFKMLNIRMFILQELYNMKFLTKNNLIDEEYIFKCPRTLKMCTLFQDIKNKK